jgi:hypothetical protein
MQTWLTSELEDENTASQLTEILTNDILKWKSLPTISISEVQAIVAYSFGNRLLPNGNRLAGPVNEELADLVVKLHLESLAHVIVQWEIAEAIGARVPSTFMTSIHPSIDAQGNISYLSTFGVAQEANKLLMSKTDSIGKVAVVAFADHLYRCISISRNVGMDAFAIEGHSMPSRYDSLSGQPWTRSRLVYLLHDLSSRIFASYDKLIPYEADNKLPHK